MMTRRDSLPLLASAAISALLGRGTAMARCEQRAPLLSPSRAWLALLGLGVDEEHDYAPAVEGALPSGLKGALFRNGPGLFERDGKKKSTLLDGDGMIRALNVNDGAARFRNRFVQTAKFKEESAAQRFLHPTWTTPAPKYFENLPEIPSLSQAGVAAVVKHGSLWAFDEVGLPYRLDPATLETLGPMDPIEVPPHEGAINYKAHTKTDGDSGAWVLVGGSAGHNPDLHVLVQDAQGRRIAHASAPNPRKHYTYYHDFFWAGRYAVFHLHPVFLSPLPMLLGQRSFADCLSWNPAEGSTLVVVDPRGERASVVVEAPAAFMWHSVNAFVSGDTIIADFVGFDAPDHFLGPDAALRNVMQGREGTANYPGTLRRFTVDLTAKRGSLETIADGHFEFPVIHPARVGQRHRYVYLASGDLHDGWFHNGVTRIDTDTGRRAEFRFGPNCCASEPAFAPDPSVSLSSPDVETSGWLICEVLDGNTRKSFIAVFDAGAIELGPIAKLHLRHHLPVGFHGWWQPA